VTTLAKRLSSPITIELAARTGHEFTFEEYLLTPITRNRYAIEDGRVIMSPAPTTKHQFIMGDVYEFLKVYVRQNKLGVVLMAPVDVIIARKPKLRTRQPDVLYLSRERAGVRGPKDLIDMPVIEVAPDIVAEVLSPHEAARSQARKMADYAALGVFEVWLIDPVGRTIAVWDLIESRYVQTAMYQSGETLRTELLPGFELDTSSLFTMEESDGDER